mgnify:CR=1 FL=1
MKFVSLALIATAAAQQTFLQEVESYLPTHQKKAEPTTPCCKSCDEPQEKYYSVDHVFNNCGEACMDPKHYWLFKIFEPGLAKDNSTNTPCADRGYHEYRETPTHGVWPISMTLDLYGPDKKEETA